MVILKKFLSKIADYAQYALPIQLYYNSVDYLVAFVVPLLLQVSTVGIPARLKCMACT